MVYRSTLLFFILMLASLVRAQDLQPPTGGLDTVFFETFEADTFDVLPSIPTGNDQSWVNYDVDNTAQICFQQEDTYGWFAYEDVNDTANFTMTSCSYNAIGAAICPQIPDSNLNWLIMPPIYVSKTNTRLEWRSLSIIGPFFMDGYKVVISEQSNLLPDFTDTAFVAAECIELMPSSSLNPNAHAYSAGYIHANKYSLSQYFAATADPGGFSYLQGKLEPHSISLADYVGKTIYCAFIHDSYCDFGLQLDDVLVVDDDMSSTQQPTLFTEAVRVTPNPATDLTMLQVVLARPCHAIVQCFDAHGRVVTQKSVDLYGGRNEVPLSVTNLQAGYYRVRIMTEYGQEQTVLVVK